MDFNRVAMLLHVVDKARGYPRLQPIHDAAMRELEDEASALQSTPTGSIGPQGATVTHPSVPAPEPTSDLFSSGGTIASRRSLAETSGGSDAA